MYATQYKENNVNLPTNSEANVWYDTSRGEMKQFIALCLLMGIAVKPEISNCWSRLSSERVYFLYSASQIKEFLTVYFSIHPLQSINTKKSPATDWWRPVVFESVVIELGVPEHFC